MAEATTPRKTRIITAGRDAMAHFTMKATIDAKGI
jgi:hypothetical protein